MKFNIIKEAKDLKIKSSEIFQNSYELKIKKDKILINNSNIIDKILLKEMFITLNPVLNNILNYLTNEDDTEEATGKHYGELAKQRSIILKKYDKYLSDIAKNEYLKKIRFLALELQKRLLTYNLEVSSQMKK